MKTIKKTLTPSLIFLAVSTAVHASDFWLPTLNKDVTNITKRQGVDNFLGNVTGELWPGIGPNGEAEGTHPLYYSRIPSLVITNDNKLVTMFDLRWNRGDDHDRIDPGVAISSNGGRDWIKKTAWTFDSSTHPKRRTMDATMIHNPLDNSIYVLHGNWKETTGRGWTGAKGKEYYENNIWFASIHKSTDGGLTWEKVQTFSKGINEDIFSKVELRHPNSPNVANPTIGFLGGVGTGIVMHDGTLVFPIQTYHKNGRIATSILYSKDNGKTWDMPATTDAKGPNNSSLENMVFELEPGKLVMTGRDNGRWAYISENMGQSWNPYTPVHGFHRPKSAATQGSSIYVTLPSGRQVLLVSKPNGNNDSWSRGNLALWVLDAKNSTHKCEVRVGGNATSCYQDGVYGQNQGVAAIRPGSGNAAGAGYSSLAYKEGNLFVAYEDDGNISVKNLTHLIPLIEAKAAEWQLPNHIEAEVTRIDALPHLNQGQKDELIAKMRKANDSATVLSNVINHMMDNLKQANQYIEDLTKTKAVLPSAMTKYRSVLATSEEAANPDSSTYLDYVDLLDLLSTLGDAYLAFNQDLDFSKYLDSAKKFNTYNNDILYRSFDNVFVSYDAGTKHNNLSLGVNKNFGDNFKAGVFMEYRNKNQKNQQFGIRAKYELGNNQLSGFVRYRGVKHDEFLERNNNVDAYLNYAYHIKLDDKLSITPSIGAYVSRQSKTLIDEDVAMNARTVYAGDVGFNMVYNLGSVKLNLRPTVAFVNDDAVLSQSNYASNRHKIKSSSVVYSLSTGIEKRFANGVAVGSKLSLQRYGSQSSNVNFGLDVSYNW